MDRTANKFFLRQSSLSTRKFPFGEQWSREDRDNLKTQEDLWDILEVLKRPSDTTTVISMARYEISALKTK